MWFMIPRVWNLLITIHWRKVHRRFLAGAFLWPDQRHHHAGWSGYTDPGFVLVERANCWIHQSGIDHLCNSWLKMSRWCNSGLSAQEPVLFGSSIMDNIRFGKPEATDAEVIHAAEQANAHRFITAFPDGYNTVVGMFRRDFLARFAFHFDAELHTWRIQVREV